MTDIPTRAELDARIAELEGIVAARDERIAELEGQLGGTDTADDFLATMQGHFADTEKRRIAERAAEGRRRAKVRREAGGRRPARSVEEEALRRIDEAEEQQESD